MKIRLFFHHYLSRLLGMRAVYTGLFFIAGSKRATRGAVLFSTTDRHEALTLWNKAKGANHGQGHIQFCITFAVIEESSRPKGVRRNRNQGDLYEKVRGPQGSVEAPVDGAKPTGPSVQGHEVTVGRVPEGVSAPAGVRSPAATPVPPAIPDPGATGAGEAVRHQDVRKDHRFDLNDMMK
jgi:hypothetical protein